MVYDTSVIVDKCVEMVDFSKKLSTIMTGALAVLVIKFCRESFKKMVLVLDWSMPESCKKVKNVLYFGKSNKKRSECYVGL